MKKSIEIGAFYISYISRYTFGNVIFLIKDNLKIVKILKMYFFVKNKFNFIIQKLNKLWLRNKWFKLVKMTD